MLTIAEQKELAELCRTIGERYLDLYPDMKRPRATQEAAFYTVGVCAERVRELLHRKAEPQ